MDSILIREAISSDLAAIKDLEVVNRMFDVDEVAFFDEMLGRFLDGSSPEDLLLVADRSH